MKLYALNGTCSLAPHILLQMCGQPFEVQFLDRSKGEHKAPEYLAINPRGKVPALQDGGAVIVENVAIQYHLASRFASLSLAPAELAARSRWLSYLSWFSSTVHPSFRRFRRPELHSPVESQWPAISEAGKTEFLAALADVDARLSGRSWLLGDSFSTADAYAHVFNLWARQMGFAIDHLQDLRRHGRAMMEMPAVQAAFRREDLPLAVFD